jgi:hypothetical protein
VASSLLLGDAFVSYRAGAFDWSSRSDRTTIESPPIPPHPSVVAPPRVQVAPPAAPVPEPQIFYGSKSGAVFVETPSTPGPAAERGPPPPVNPPQHAQQAQQSAVIMSGSKSLMPGPSILQQGSVQTQQTNRRDP